MAGSCGNKVKSTCVERTYATCVQYETQLPDFSSLVEQDCVTVEETTEDIYNLIEEVRTEIDLSALGESCLEYVTVEGKNIVKNVLLKYEQEICLLKDRVEVLETEAICNKDITQCGLDLSGLVDQCDAPITTLGQLLEYLLTRLP